MIKSRGAKRAAIVLLLAMLSACGITTQNLSPTDALGLSSGEAILVLGVRNSSSVGFKKGTTEGEVWRRPFMTPFAFRVPPEDGYVVVRLPVSQDASSYGLTDISVGTDAFFTCENTVSFDVRVSKVLYVGDIEFLRQGRQLSFQLVQREDRARQYIESRFPSLAKNFVANPAKVRSTTDSNCVGTTVVPIYIGR